MKGKYAGVAPNNPNYYTNPMDFVYASVDDKTGRVTFSQRTELDTGIPLTASQQKVMNRKIAELNSRYSMEVSNWVRFTAHLTDTFYSKDTVSYAPTGKAILGTLALETK